MPTIGFRLAIRNAADDEDEFIVTSVPNPVNPEDARNYLTEPPSVDGASADLLAGIVDVGAGTIKFWDEIVVVGGGSLRGEDGFEAWSTTNPAFANAGGPYTGTITTAGGAHEAYSGWGVNATAGGGGAFSGGAVLQGANSMEQTGTFFGYTDLFGDGVDSSRYLERTITGLLPGAAYVFNLWYGVGLSVGAILWDNPVVTSGYGLHLLGAGADSYGVDVVEQQWVMVQAGQTARPDGTITVRIGTFNYNEQPNHTARFIYYDALSWRGAGGAGEGRIYTRELHALVDGVARLTQLSRKARIEQTIDGGATWLAYHRGYLNRLEVDGGEWTVTVGDTTRQEQQTELFATLPTLDPASVGLPMPAPRVGLILGGPIASDPTYGPFAGITDYGPTRWKVEETLLDAAGDDRLVRLKFLAGYLRPWYYASRARFDQDEWEKVNNAGRPYFVWDPTKYESHPYPLSTVNSFGYFPDLVARLDPVGAGAVLEKMPIARPIKHEPDDKHTPKAEYDALTGNDSVLYVDWGPDDPFPDVDDAYDVTLYSPVISEKNPLLMAGHPVDLIAYAASLSGIPWNAASRVSAKAALGEGLWYEWKVTGPKKFADAQKELGGFFGFLFRPDLSTGERHFIPTRVRPVAPQFLITDADRIDATDGSGDGQPTVWAAEEDSVVNVVTFTTQRFRWFRYKEDSGDPPVTMLAEATAEVEGKRGDTTVNGERTQKYELTGQLQRRAADGTVTPLILATQDPANPGYAEDAGGVIVDFAGWGVPESVVLVDAASAAALAQIGDEGVVDLPDLPVPDVDAEPITQRGLGPRVMRVVKRDPQVGAVQLTLVHAGELSQAAVAAPASGGSADPGTPELPTLALDAASTAPTTVVTVTLTNGADLSADNLRTELEYLVQAGTPAGSDEGADFGPVTAYPDGDSTTIDTPSVAPGSVVWVRARSVNATTGVASAWTAWTSYTLDPIENGGGGPGETPYAPTLSVSAVVDPTTGDVTATANASASAVSVKFAIGPVGGAPPSLADVRAATPDSSAPFASGTLATLTAGHVRTVGALAYDAVGNESAMATAPAVRGIADTFDLTGAAHGDLLYVDAAGASPVLVRLSIPPDWDDPTKDYVLGIGDGVPTWRILTPPVLAPLGDFSDDFSEDFS